MIDLSLMRGVHVDPAQRLARVSGGALLGDLDGAAQRHGLATTAGLVSHTGIGGFTLGGGLGHLMRAHGLAVDNLVTVDLVTAEGNIVTADADHEPELFWGLRGGGGNFGIATSFTFRLHPVGPIVLAGPVFWPLEDAPEVLAAVDDAARNAPDALGLAVTLRLAPPLAVLPPARVGTPVVGVVMVWSADPAAGERAMAPLRGVGTPIADAVRPTPYLAIQSMLDAGNPHGLHYYWRSRRLDRLADVTGALVDAAGAITSPMSYVAGLVVGGAASRASADATAVGGRTVGVELNAVAAWPGDDTDPDRHLRWVRGLSDRLAPHARGVFSHFLSDEGSDGVTAAYGDRLTRLRRLKDCYDPDNVFRHNPNVVPTNGTPR